MSEGPYRVEDGWIRFGDMLISDSICDLLNSAFAAGLEQNAKYKAAWEELEGALFESFDCLDGVQIYNIARKHGIKEGE